ncbi:MAG TPA: dienelactone hydrolase family protein [Solirubrobacteraceae bacterium]|nr:dienelactone hydrolase family protein [Solirubrobacteraceae bacterium]
MSGRLVEVTTPDGVADAYLARPDGDGRHPGVLLIHDAFGLRPQIERMAQRIAAEGFAVLVPNLYYRAGRAPVVSMDGVDDPERRGALMERIRPVMQSLTPDRIAADADAYLDRLAQEGDGPFAITGYCMGGRLGWLIAAAHPDRVAALGAFHTGRMVTEDADSPHLLAGRIAAEVYFGHADNDQGMTPDNVAAIDHALEAAGVRHRSEIYEGAGHGYTMADTPVYDEAASERHFSELFALLERTVAA